MIKHISLVTTDYLLINGIELPYICKNIEIRELKRKDLDIISLWPKYEYPFAWANFNIVNDLLKDNWMNRNKRLDTIWFVILYSGEMIARGSLIYPEEEDELIFGIVMRKDRTNRGLGTKCVSSVMRMIFSTSNIDQVWLETKQDNLRAQKVWKKVGFEGVSTHYRRDVYGVYARYLGFRLTKSNFTDNYDLNC